MRTCEQNAKTVVKRIYAQKWENILKKQYIFDVLWEYDFMICPDPIKTWLHYLGLRPKNPSMTFWDPLGTSKRVVSFTDHWKLICKKWWIINQWSDIFQWSRWWWWKLICHDQFTDHWVSNWCLMQRGHRTGDWLCNSKSPRMRSTYLYMGWRLPQVGAE